MSWKTFTLLYRKLIQDTAYQILLESTGLCRRYDKNISVCFLSVHSVDSVVYGIVPNVELIEIINYTVLSNFLRFIQLPMCGNKKPINLLHLLSHDNCGVCSCVIVKFFFYSSFSFAYILC